MDKFTYDGIDYYDGGNVIYNVLEQPIMTICLDVASEYWIAEADNGFAETIHVNEPNARDTLIRSMLSSEEC